MIIMAYEKKPWSEYKAGDIVEIRGKRYEVAVKFVNTKVRGGHKLKYYKIYFRAFDTLENRIATMYSDNIIKFDKMASSGRSGNNYDEWTEENLKHLVDKMESNEGHEIDKKLIEGYHYSY